MIKYSREEKYSRPVNVKEFLAIAMEREKSSVGFYENMLKHSFAKIPALSSMINKLREAEAGHVKIIAEMLNSLG